MVAVASPRGGLWSAAKGSGLVRLCIGLGTIALVLFVALFAPLIAPQPPDLIDFMSIASPPSTEHLLGTDEAGRDILSRIFYGARVSVAVVFVSVFTAMLFGVSLGLVSGYRGGWVDDIIMRVIDIVISFPTLVLALLIIALLGPGLQNAIVAISIVYIPYFARLTRGEVLSLKSRDYVSAALSTGTPHRVILFKEILPNLLGNIVVYASLAASEALITESALSFLGLGVQPPTPSWGYMIAAGMQYSSYWWISLFPGLAIFVTVIGFNFLGDTLRDAFDPTLARRTRSSGSGKEG